MAYLFESDRLGFRNWKNTDLDAFVKINADPTVMAFFPKRLSAEETAQMKTRLQAIFDENGYTFFAVDILKTGEFIGFIGFIETSFEAYFTPCIEIGWRLKKSVWNMGYATEGAKACLDYGFNTLGFLTVHSFTAEINKKSQRIMQKIGMSHVGSFNHPKVPLNHKLNPHVLYKIERHQPVI